MTPGDRVSMSDWCDGTVTEVRDGVVWVRWDCWRRPQPHLPEHLIPASEAPVLPSEPRKRHGRHPDSPRTKESRP